MSIFTNRNEFAGRTSPSYIRVREWLAQYISEQKLAPGAKIPSDRALADALGLSRPTIARAVQALVEEGILVREERSGTFVGSQLVKEYYSGERCTIGVFTPWIVEDSSGRITGRRHFRWASVSPPGGDVMSLQIIHGVLSVLNSHGHRLQIHSTREPEEESKALSLLEDGLVEGAVMIPEVHEGSLERYKNLAKSHRPLVFVDQYLPEIDVDHVVTDNFGAAQQMVNYLISKGHRRIAYFTDFTEASSVIDRETGYRRALEDAGIEVDEELICGPQNLRSGEWSMDIPLEHCVKSKDPATAIFCMYDELIWAAMTAASRLGMSVPGDLDIAGFFDEHIPEGINVPFTRAMQSTFDMGRVASQLLLERLAGEVPPEPRHICLPVRIIPATMG